MPRVDNGVSNDGADDLISKDKTTPYHWGLCLLLFCFFFFFKRIKFSFLRIILGHQHVRRYVTPYNNQGSKEN